MTNIQVSFEDGETDPIKKFPIDVFPQEIVEIIQAYVDSLNINVDYASASFLVAFAASMGARYSVQVKRGWVEFACIFLALVGRPGINKSGPLSIFTQPLETIDFELFDYYREELKGYKKRMRDEDKEKNFEEPPIRRQIVIKDSTQEALLQAMFRNPHGCNYSAP